MNYNKKVNWEFYTTTKDGKETLIATKMLKEPNKSKIYKDIINKGFINGIYSYGYRLAENN